MNLQGPTEHLSLALNRGRATLRYRRQAVASWPAIETDTLTTSAAQALEAPNHLVVVDRAAPQALEVLRTRGVPYVTRAGEWHIVQPPELVIVRPATRRSDVAPSAERPLGRGVARVARWLLLHPDQAATITGLARAALVSEATSSRAISQLAERALVEVAVDADARRRAVRVADASGLLNALADETSWHRARRTTWDIGAHSAAAALEEIRRLAAKGTPRYAIGELAGASLRVRVAEPATVTLWIDPHDLAAWESLLLATSARPAPGRVVVRLAPDPGVLAWGETIDGLSVADPVQLYIDCRHAGERAIDTADAMADLVLKR